MLLPLCDQVVIVKAPALPWWNSALVNAVCPQDSEVEFPVIEGTQAEEL